MDRLYHNYLLVAVAGMFSLLNSNMVSAQANDVACAGCIGWFEFAPDVRRRFIQQEARIEELEALVATLQAGIVPNLGTYLRIDETDPQRPTAWFEAVNVMVVNGTGTTMGATNGLGNLIVGYDEFAERNPNFPQFPDDKSGSHNLVVGPEHNYSSVGGFVAGGQNNIFADHAAVSGGWNNTASDEFSSVSGGQNNTASGNGSSVSGGRDNTASGTRSSVSGGVNNTTSGSNSSVSGGEANTASGTRSSVRGGFNNTADGRYSSVSGGANRTAPGESDWVAGALFQDD